MHKIIPNLSVCLLFLSGTMVFADESIDNSLSWLSTKDRATLTKTREISYTADRYDQLTLWKNSPFEQSVQKLYSGRPATIAAEGMFLIDLPAGTLPLSPNLLVHSATAISTMKGLQVYSDSKKAMETFIYEAYRVSTTDKATRMPDPPFQNVSDQGSFTMFQNEEQTGESFAEFGYARQPTGIEVSQTNLTGLNYGIIQLIAPHQMLTHIYITQVGKQLLVYGIIEANTIQFLGLEKTKIHSLYNRMKALVTWFSGNLANFANSESLK